MSFAIPSKEILTEAISQADVVHLFTICIIGARSKNCRTIASSTYNGFSYATRKCNLYFKVRLIQK
ncbi:MAG: hypothetical protein ACLS9A_06580 [Clostridia bacterium]